MLLFSLDVVVLVELSVVYKIHFGENLRESWFQMSLRNVQVLVILISGERLAELRFLKLKPYILHPQNFSS